MPEHRRYRVDDVKEDFASKTASSKSEPSETVLQGIEGRAGRRHFHLDCRGAVFSVRIVNNWIKRPPILINVPSVLCFINV